MKKNKLKRKHSIRTRILQSLLLFAVFVMALLWLLQVFLLDEFYRIYTVAQIDNVADTITRNIDNDSLDVLCERLSAQHSTCILLMDDNGKLLINVESERSCIIHRMTENNLKWYCQKVQEMNEKYVEYYTTEQFVMPSYNSTYFVGPVPETSTGKAMTMLYILPVTQADGKPVTLMLNAAITPVTSTIAMLRFQLSVLTVIVMAAAIVIAITVSYYLSRPIIETNTAAHELSHSEYTTPPHGNAYSEMAELNSTLENAAKDLNQVEHFQHELVANISHDLRTPLTMIGGYAEMIRDIPSEATPENMQVIIDETARLSTLVNELLDLSRLQTGTAKLTISRFDLTSTIQEIIQRINALTAKDGYTIGFEEQEHVYVDADDTRIGQVIYNLIGNALTYTGQDKHVEVEQQVKADHVIIRVSDSGKGIPAEELDLIWNRYYRTKETHKRAVVGSGLGLNIVQTILETHGAKYGVDSVLGHGTTFYFELPLSKEKETADALS